MHDKISASIDVKKVEKAHLKEGKNGALYLEMVLLPSTNDRFGNDYMIVQSIPKDLRDAGQRGPILGNAKFFGSAKVPRASTPPAGKYEDADQIPF